MAFYTFALRNVRQAHETAPAGVKDAPRDMEVYYFTHEDTGIYSPTEAKALVMAQLPSFTKDVMDTLTTQAILGNANSTARASDVTGACLLRYGKQMFQLGCGYHGSVGSAAIASVNWKNIA